MSSHPLFKSSAPIHGNYQSDFATTYVDQHCLKPQQHLEHQGRRAEDHGFACWRWPSARDAVRDKSIGLASNLTSMRVAGAALIVAEGATPRVLGKLHALPPGPGNGGRRRAVGGQPIRGRTCLRTYKASEQWVEKKADDSVSLLEHPAVSVSFAQDDTSRATSKCGVEAQDDTSRATSKCGVEKENVSTALHPVGQSDLSARRLLSPRGKHHPSPDMVPLPPRDMILREEEPETGHHRWR